MKRHTDTPSTGGHWDHTAFHQEGTTQGMAGKIDLPAQGLGFFSIKKKRTA